MEPAVEASSVKDRLAALMTDQQFLIWAYVLAGILQRACEVPIDQNWATSAGAVATLKGAATAVDCLWAAFLFVAVAIYRTSSRAGVIN